MATPIQKKLEGPVLSKECDAIPVIKRTARGKYPRSLVFPLPRAITEFLISIKTAVYIQIIIPVPRIP